MTSDFDKRALDLGRRIHWLVKNWSPSLTDAFAKAAYTSEQQKIIAARIPIAQGDTSDLGALLHKAFFASPNNVVTPFYTFELSSDEEKIKSLKKLIYAINDMTKNLPMLLQSDNLPQNAKKGLEILQTEIVPELERLLDDISDATRINPKKVKEYPPHNEHLQALPDNFPGL